MGSPTSPFVNIIVNKLLEYVLNSRLQNTPYETLCGWYTIAVSGG